MTFRKCVAATALVFFCTTAFSAPSDAEAPRLKPSLTVTFTSENGDGTRIVETRHLDARQAEALGIFSGPVLEAEGPPAPPVPRPPMNGSVPSTTTRVDIHQEDEYWTRDTTFSRAGVTWIITNDTLKATRPPKCYTHPPQCDTLPQ